MTEKQFDKHVSERIEKIHHVLQIKAKEYRKTTTHSITLTGQQRWILHTGKGIDGNAGKAPNIRFGPW